MKQFKKLLSVLMAVIMILSSVSMIANAYGTAWKDDGVARSQYNSIDVPTLTTEQYATAALDEVDRMLDEEQILLTEEDIFVGTLDVTSVNAALDSVNTILNGSLWTQYNSLLGDLDQLNISALTVRRTNGGSDVAVINSLLRFLYDNKGLLSDFVKGNLDLGTIVAQFVDLSDFEVPGLLKGLLYEAVYPERPEPDTVTETVDTMAQDIIDALVVTGYDGDEPLLPALAGHTNISTGNMLSFIDDALKIVYNEWLVPRANEVWMDDINELLADNAEEIDKYKNYFNLKDDGTVNFEFQPYDFDDNKLVLEQLNDILASIINLALADDIGFEWETGDNSMIVDNIINIGREVLAVAGRDLFSSYVEIYDKAKLDTMTDMQVVAYVVRTILNSSIDAVWIPNTADNLTKVCSYLVKDLMATELPERDYSDETAYPVDDVNTIYTILTDFGVKALNENPGLNLNYGIGIDALAKEAANWAITKYGGLLSGVTLSTANTGWNNLDTLLFKIANRNWFDASLFNGKAVNAENLVKDVIINNVLNLDLENVVALLCNKSSSSEFVSCTPKQFILNLVTRIINIVFPNFLKTNMTTLEEIITAQNLGDSVDAIFTDLWEKRGTLVAAVLPIVTDILDLTTAETFKTPEFDLDSYYYIAGGAANTDFTITNRSYGVNTGWTDPADGSFHQDSLFQIKLISATAVGTVAKTNPVQTKTLTVTLPSDKTLNGGEKATLHISGAFTGVTDTVVTITYDIIKEDGQPLTSAPLEARIYTCFSTTNTDELVKFTTTTGNFIATDGVKNIFTTSVSGLDDVEVKVKNKTANNAEIKAYAANSTTGMTALSFVETNDEVRPILAGGSATYKPLVIKGYEGTEAQDLEAYSNLGFKKYTQNLGVNIVGTTTNVQTSCVISLYKDYGLNSLFNKEVNAQRQRSDYDSAAFDAYLTAMKNAANLVMTKKQASNFCLNTAMGTANKYQDVAAALVSAIEALEETATGGVSAIRARLTEIDPSNADKDFMTDGDYSFFGAANYLTYTWSNFRDRQKDADNFAEKYEEGGKYGPDSEDPQKPAALDVAMTLWELNNYYARLRPVDGSKVNLNRAVNEANEKAYAAEDYTEESFARYEAAIAFADEVNNEAGAVQKKINMAYEELILAQKRLLVNEGEETDVTLVPNAENPFNGDYDVLVIENCDGEKLLYGVATADYEIDIKDYFVADGGDIDDFTFEYDEIATGATVTVYDKNGDVVDEYIMVVKGDVDGSSDIAGADATKLDRVIGAMAVFSDSGESAFDYAADIDGSGDLAGSDSTALGRYLSAMAEIDFAKYEF